MNDPQSTYFEDEHRHLFNDFGIEILVERFRERDGDLIADVFPRNALGSGSLPSEKLNLSSARSIKTYSNTLAQRPLQGEIDWFALLSKAADLSKVRYRQGAPPTVLADVEWRGSTQFIVPPWVDAHGTTILFGDGGVSKSVHALAFSVAVATGIPIIGDEPQVVGPVVYIDYEADETTHAERLSAICSGAGIEVPRNIFYLPRSASLGESVREIRKVIANEGAVFCVLDSIGAASGGDPEKAESIIRTMNALRALDVPPLATHHVTKDQKDKTKPFGSVYAANLARRTVRLDREQEEDSPEIVVRLTTMKANFGRLAKARGHKVVFESDPDGWLRAIRFEEASWSDLPSGVSSSGAKYDALAALRDSRDPLTVQQLSDMTGHKYQTLYHALTRNQDWFAVGPHGWTMRASTDIASEERFADPEVQTFANEPNFDTPVPQPPKGAVTLSLQTKDESEDSLDRAFEED